MRDGESSKEPSLEGRYGSRNERSDNDGFCSDVDDDMRLIIVVILVLLVIR